MCVNSITEKVEVSFNIECKCLLDIHDDIGIKGDKTHVKR